MNKIPINDNSAYPQILLNENFIKASSFVVTEKMVHDYLQIRKPYVSLEYEPCKPGKRVLSFDDNKSFYLIVFSSLILFIIWIFTGNLICIFFSCFIAHFLFYRIFDKDFGLVIGFEYHDLNNPKYLKKKQIYLKQKEYVKSKNEKLLKESYENFQNLLNSMKREIQLSYIEIKKQYFTPKNIFIRDVSFIKRGRFEIIFLEKLIDHFENNVYMDVKVTANISDYRPDFVIIDIERGMHFDIEIDEPYSLTEMMPTHFIGSNDSVRNDYFLNNNWGVIRFSENQIKNQPDDCIILIKLVFAKLREGTNLDLFSNIQIEKSWTYEHALLMIKNKTRN